MRETILKSSDWFHTFLPYLGIDTLWVNFQPVIMALVVFQLGGHPPETHLKGGHLVPSWQSIIWEQMVQHFNITHSHHNRSPPFSRFPVSPSFMNPTPVYHWTWFCSWILKCLHVLLLSASQTWDQLSEDRQKPTTLWEKSSQSKLGLLQWRMALAQPSQLVRGAGFNQNTKMVEINAWQQFWGFGRNCIRQWTPPGRQSDCLCPSSFSNQQTPSWCQGCTSWGWSGRCQGCLHPMQYQTKPPWDVLQFCIIHWINGNLLVSSVRPIWMWSIKIKRTTLLIDFTFQIRDCKLLNRVCRSWVLKNMLVNFCILFCILFILCWPLRCDVVNIVLPKLTSLESSPCAIE